MKNNLWAPASKCFAALILSVALLGCGSNGSNSPAMQSEYPVVGVFQFINAYPWCAAGGLDMTIPGNDDICIDLYFTELKTRLFDYYGTSLNTWDICDTDPSVERCTSPWTMERYSKAN